MQDNFNNQLINLGQLMGLELEFVESCLPLTMNIADKYRKIIENSQDFPSNSWAYHDKVLVWIFPTFRDDLEKFHLRQGQELVNLINFNALKHIDEVAFDLLKEKLNVSHY
jgi:hypothetical protein